LLDDRRIRIWIRIHTSDYWIRIWEAQKHVDPVDPDSDSDFGPGTPFGRGLYGGNTVYQALVYTHCIESIFCIILKKEKQLGLKTLESINKSLPHYADKNIVSCNLEQQRQWG
jgi:hypothetical protein